MSTSTDPAPLDLIEAMIGYLETSRGYADVEFGIADRDYRVVWDSSVSGESRAIDATIYDTTELDSRVVAEIRVHVTDRSAS